MGSLGNVQIGEEFSGEISRNVESCSVDSKTISRQRKFASESFEKVSTWDTISTYICYAVLFAVGHVEAILSRKGTTEKYREGYHALYASFESFFTRHIFRRLKHIHVQCHGGVAGSRITLLEKTSNDGGWTFELTGRTQSCTNFGSYNYLGFAENEGTCATKTIASIKQFGVGTCSTRKELGNSKLQNELDSLVARFIGVEDAITCAMGFATNTLNIPAIMDETCLVLSDSKNHCSIIVGLRLSGATVRKFKHNGMKSLEKLIRQGIVKGRPRIGLPWSKIFVVVEGLYSMEGSLARLPEIIALKKKYGIYIYMDEAHSIGAMGPRGRGICDYWGCDPKDVDILMGTFTKSFGSAGGYIAGSRQLISMLRKNSHAYSYGTVMSPAVTTQILTSMKIIMGEDGTKEGIKRLRALRRNSRYFRQKLKQAGFIVYGNDDSPVVPTALYMPSKCAYVVKELVRRGVATVAVGYPATELVEARTRFCISSAHTKEILDHALSAMCEVGADLMIRNSRIESCQDEILYESGDVDNDDDLYI